VTSAALTPILADRLSALDEVPASTDGSPSPELLAALDAFGATVGDYRAPDVDVIEAAAPGPHGTVPIRIYQSTNRRPSHGLVWVHGGGFMFGDLDMPESDVVARELVVRASIVVVAVDYRLCVDGVHFPVPHDDVHAAFEWASKSTLLRDEGGWAIGGASAGGNLTAGVAQRLRDEGAGASALVLAYPVVHHHLPGGSPVHRARLATLPAALRFPAAMTETINANFLGGNDAETPYAFAALGDLHGLPRTLVIVGDHDELTPSGEDFARRLAECAVPVEMDRVVGVAHGHLNVPGLPEALASIDRIADFVTGM